MTMLQKKSYNLSKNEFNRLHMSTNNLLNWFLQPKSNCLNNEPYYELDRISNQIFCSYDIINAAATEQHKIKINKIKKEKYLDDYLLPILDIKEYIEANEVDKYIVDFIIHGSIATLDYIKGWSDLDAIIVIKNKTIQDPYLMRKFREKSLELDGFLYKIDPLQHHGILYLTEYDLKNYSNIYFPTNLFANSKTLLAARELEFSVRDSQKEQIERIKSIHHTFRKAASVGTLWHHPYAGEYLHENYSNAHNGMYQFKYFLSVIMLLPTAFMNARGVYCDKKDSFELCRGFISTKNWDIIDRASKVRTSWREHPFVGNEIPIWAREIFGQEYFKKAYRLVDEMLITLNLK